MAKTEWTTGSSVYVTANFTDPRDADAPVDPTTVTLSIIAPGEAAVAADPEDITNPAVGTYEYVLLLAQQGTYRWKWTGTTGDKVIVIPGACDSLDPTA
jgi:hypothetical protein